MDIFIIVLRICIWSTFCMTAIGVPYLIVRLNVFMKLYLKRHAELVVRVEAVEGRVRRLEEQRDADTR